MLKTLGPSQPGHSMVDWGSETGSLPMRGQLQTLRLPGCTDWEAGAVSQLPIPELSR